MYFLEPETLSTSRFGCQISSRCTNITVPLQVLRNWLRVHVSACGLDRFQAASSGIGPALKSHVASTRHSDWPSHHVTDPRGTVSASGRPRVCLTFSADSELPISLFLTFTFIILLSIAISLGVLCCSQSDVDVNVRMKITMTSEDVENTSRKEEKLRLTEAPVDHTRVQLALTGCLVLQGIECGFFLALTGPIMIDLKRQIGTDISQLVWLFLGKSVGYILGIALAAYFYRKPTLLILILALTNTSSCVAMPLCRAVWQVTVASGVQSVSLGLLMTSAGAITTRIWGRDNSTPAFQAIISGLCTGVVCGPLLSLTVVQENSSEDRQNLNPLFFAVAVYSVVISVIGYVCFWRWTEQFDCADKIELINTENGFKTEKMAKTVILLVLTITLAMMQGSEMGASIGYLTVYVVDMFDVQPPVAVWLTFMYLFSATIASVIGIFTLKHFTCNVNLYGLLTIQLAALILFWLGRDSLVVTGVTLLFYGLGCGNVLASILAWAEQSLGNSKFLAAAITMFSFFAEIFVPFLVGIDFQAVNFLYWQSGIIPTMILSTLTGELVTRLL